MKPSGLHCTIICITPGCNNFKDKETLPRGNEGREQEEAEEAAEEEEVWSLNSDRSAAFVLYHFRRIVTSPFILFCFYFA
jgi:hypothetical protein